ncbi:TRAP transporter small permease subunit [Halioxenophilus sp. WMMB6]|uniref:TRAP transporter small permease subunit n=1 Tax=Halioxenophilus sp. WMMB6 TaxID=3073815 RepID=UPI00295EFD63|nr:TRAP transporter small permease subunit [Halioxenophilus sp. WMMB6]
MPNHAPVASQSSGFAATLVTTLDQFARVCGYTCAAMIPLMVAITFAVVVLRKGFQTGSIAMQESITYLHAWVFLVAMAFTLKTEGQVRVDIFYRKFNHRQQAWVNAIGGLVLLMPLCVVLLITSWDYALRSWEIHETSAEAGGLPFVYLLKSFLPLSATLLLLQCLAEVVASTLCLIERPVQRSEQ